MATATRTQRHSTARRPVRSRGARRGVELSPQRLFDAAGPVPKGVDREERLEEVVGLFGEGVEVTTRRSAKGNYVSVTAEVEMGSSDEVLEIYRQAHEIGGVMAL